MPPAVHPLLVGLVDPRAYSRPRYNEELKQALRNVNYNDGLYVTFLDASRTVTYTSASGLMFGNGFWTRGVSATVQFATGNGVEVCFDNSDVTRILSMDRDLPPFFAANRRFFLRALFDPSAVSQIKKGFIETFTPTVDYL
jgi:hypothetical protein